MNMPVPPDSGSDAITRHLRAEKKALRKQMKALRAQISPEEYQLFSEAITARVLALPEVQAAGVIHVFSAMESQREPATQPLIKKLMQGNKRIVVPVMQWEERQLHHVGLRPETPLLPNKWGIPEPPVPAAHKKSVSGAGGSARLMAPETLDVVLVPLLAGDRKGNRLGYGKGFYDRFLHQLRPDAACFGLLYDAGLFDEIPAEPHDCPLDGFITEKQVLRVG